MDRNGEKSRAPAVASKATRKPKPRAGDPMSQLPPEASEDEIEWCITNFLARALPADAVSFHVPNEGRRGRRMQAQFKKAGGKSGVLDRCIMWRERAYMIEAKSALGARSVAQRAFCDRLDAALIPWAVVRSVEDVELVLREWGIPLRATVFGASVAK